MPEATEDDTSPSTHGLAPVPESLVDQRFRKLIATSPDFISIIDAHGNLRYGNPVAERIFGYPEMDYVGRPALELVHPDDRQRATTALLRDLAEPGVHPPGTYRLRVGDGAWRLFEVRATNLLDDEAINGVVLTGRDVSESVSQSRALRMLGQANRALVHAVDERRLLQHVCTTIVETGGYVAAWVGYLQHDADASILPVAAAGNVANFAAAKMTTADGVGLIAHAVRTRAVQVASTDEPDASAPPIDAGAPNEIASRCVLPLVVAGGAVGVIEVGAGKGDEFEPSEIALLSELADSLAYGIGRIRDAESLAVSEERYRSLASASPIGILEVDGSSGVTYANPTAYEIAGLDDGELLGQGWLSIIHPDDLDGLMAVIADVGEDVTSFSSRFRILQPSGEIRHVLMSAGAKDTSADTDWAVTIVDESQEVHAHEELTHQALYDTLTDLPNRALFLVRLRQELSWSEREHVNIAVLFLDLDLFKLVNDSLGHDAGDCVLKEVSQRFLATIRSSETAARLGGDEFMFIIRDVRKVDDAIVAARRLLDSLDSPIRYRDQSLLVSGSIGIVIPGHGADADTVLRDADTAMYQAKAAGRNRFELFDEELHHRSVSRLEKEGDLRAAIERKEFVLHYQPIVDPRSGCPVGAEALVRWQHPVHGLVPPLEFISVAEESGLIRSIGNWVFDEAVTQMAAWDQNLDAPQLELLSVNFSARQLDDVDEAQRIGAVLARLGVDPRRVDIEVTESVAMADRLSTKASLQAFKDLGLRASIDDFGTGYSSLAYLHTLPVATVKIDRSFIERLDEPDGSTPVVSAILDLSHAMGLRVIAEGVSSATLRSMVADMGCDLAQGFFWSKPLPADQFANWWSKAWRRAGHGGVGRAATRAHAEALRGP
jgi:diguanylate cyclase (GGDEF)-like protein/PAS domain S-box-containing protein